MTIELRISDFTDINLLAELSDIAYIEHEKSYGVSHFKKGDSKKLLRVSYKLQEIGDTYIYKVEKDKEIIGGIIISQVSTSILHIKSIFIHPKFQDKGIGKEVMRKIEELHPKKCWILETPTWAKKNIEFYRSMDYNIVGDFQPENIPFYKFEKDLRR